jgi:ribosomal 50S subunit-associated protein YjgA (DUF615 family)
MRWSRVEAYQRMIQQSLKKKSGGKPPLSYEKFFKAIIQVSKSQRSSDMDD